MPAQAHADRHLVAEVRTVLAAAGDPGRATAQRAYLHSALPFHGVALPQVRRLLAPLWAAYRPGGRAGWEATVRALWDDATHREERYAALALARHPVSAPFRTPAALPLHRHLVVTGAWWDLVDETAQHLVGPLLLSDRAVVDPVLRDWLADDDLWLRRAVVIVQVGHRGRTDPVLLHDAVEATVDDPSSWLRKAVGWALRDYSLTDPAWVRAEVARLGVRMSGLSRREALRRLEPRRAPDESAAVDRSDRS